MRSALSPFKFPTAVQLNGRGRSAGVPSLAGAPPRSLQPLLLHSAHCAVAAELHSTLPTGLPRTYSSAHYPHPTGSFPSSEAHVHHSHSLAFDPSSKHFITLSFTACMLLHIRNMNPSKTSPQAKKKPKPRSRPYETMCLPTITTT